MHWCVRATQRAGAVVGVGLVMPEVLCDCPIKGLPLWGSTQSEVLHAHFVARCGQCCHRPTWPQLHLASAVLAGTFCPGGQGKAYKPIACCVIRWACVCTGSPDVPRLAFSGTFALVDGWAGHTSPVRVVEVLTHPPPIPPPVAAPCMHWCVRATQRAGAAVGVGLATPEVLCVCLAPA